MYESKMAKVLNVDLGNCIAFNLTVKLNKSALIHEYIHLTTFDMSRSISVVVDTIESNMRNNLT